MAVEEKNKIELAKYVPILLVFVAAGLLFASGANEYLSVHSLQKNHTTLAAFVEDSFWVSLALYALTYILVAAFALPGAGLLSILGGFLFGPKVAFPIVVISATIGATCIFLAAKTAFGDLLKAKVNGFFKKMEEGFKGNAFSYLLLLRLIPIFPFFIVNVAPAFFGISTSVFIATTFLGIIPGVFAYVSAGNGLVTILENGGELSLQELLFQPEIITPIIALSALALLPLLSKILGFGRKSANAA
ncbi:MAG: TVP38/TMEM64 family protein [Pseudomonadota bacterium]